MAVDMDYRLYLGGSDNKSRSVWTNGYNASSNATNPVFEEYEDLDLDTSAQNINEYTPKEVIKNMNDIKEWIISIGNENAITPNEAIQYYLDAGFIDEVMANELVAYFTTYNERDTKSIEKEMETKDCSRSEAIANLTRRGQIGEPIRTADDYLSTEAETEKAKSEIHITEAGIKNYVEDMIYAAVGGDGGNLTKFLNDPKLSSADMVAIAKKYPGSISKDIDKVYGALFSGDKRKKAQEKYVAVLVEQAKLGNQDAIDLLCKELYNSTAAKIGTSDEFVDAFFKQADEELIAKVNENYGKVNEGRDLQTDIEKDFSGKTEEEYVSLIENTKFYVMN